MKVFFGVNDPDEELSSVDFFRIAERLPAYRGAVRQQMEIYTHEHREEIEAMQKENAKPKALPVTREQLQNRSGFGHGAPEMGQAAPLFQVSHA